MLIDAVADWFLSQSAMTPKKLQKLCYYAEAWSCALYNRRLVEDSQFEAWIHGPVSPKLYREYKNFFWNEIPTKEFHEDITEEDNNLLNSVWLTYGDKSANELEALTHSELPWQKARVGLNANENSKNVISFDDMRDFYRSIYIGD